MNKDLLILLYQVKAGDKSVEAAYDDVLELVFLNEKKDFLDEYEKTLSRTFKITSKLHLEELKTKGKIDSYKGFFVLPNEIELQLAKKSHKESGKSDYPLSDDVMYVVHYPDEDTMRKHRILDKLNQEKI